MKKESFLEKLSYLKANGLMPIVYRQVKVTSFHITLEMLITVYIMELTAVLTRFFLINSNNIFQVFIVMVAPLIITIPVASVYSAFYAIYYINRLHYYYSHYDLKVKTNNISIMFKKYKKEVIIAHTLGTVFYIVGAVSVSVWIGVNYNEHFKSVCSLIICMGTIGGGMGLIWNVTGYFRDQRVLWNKIVDGCNDNILLAVSKLNFKCYLGNIVGNAFSAITIFISLAIIFFNISLTLDIKSLTTDYWFLIIYLFVILGVYIKYVFGFVYSNKNKGQVLYAPLDDILNQYNNIK